MRLVILSDIHGNPIALDAVQADIQSQEEVDAYWVLGDFAALGYDPVTPLEKITALPHASFTRGNTDRYVVTGDLPVQPEKALEDPALLPEVIEAVRSFSWTRGYLSAAGWLAARRTWSSSGIPMFRSIVRLAGYVPSIWAA